jgi:formamidopyrimidine-DNA glycosylase
MPELPEVEAVRVKLSDFLSGHKVEGVEIRNSKTFIGDSKKLIGTKFLSFRRFGKVLVLDLDNNYSLLVHLKLTGQLIYRGPKLTNPPPLSKKVIGGIPGPHTLVIFNLDRGGKLYYNDIRRFGWIKLEGTDKVGEEKFIKALGPEPPVFGNHSGKVLSLDSFAQILSKTTRPIKIVLMDQNKIAGIGNIYANDALWLAGINPRRPSNSLSSKEVEKLFKSVVEVLKEGIKRGGSSENTFVTPEGVEGEYQDFTLIYGRDKEKCKRCGAEIEKIQLSGRGTYFCPHCQK